MHPCATLDIHLPALAANYRVLKSTLGGRICAAVVKADGYGLGAHAISKALEKEGCRFFFVATCEEAVALRQSLPQAHIFVFQGLLAGEENAFVEQRLSPVLNDRAQLERWETIAAQSPAGAALHVDTGMARLGFSQSELEPIDQERLSRAQVKLLLSHLACANTPDHAKNAEQLARFKKAYARFPGMAASLANSAGVFLSAEYHFDLARPGCALYGINPADGANPMQPVATLSAPVLQIRALDCDESVGYGATATAKKGSKLAICALGYADGFLRCLSNRGSAFVGGQKVPLLGRVSMDMVALDVSSLAESALLAPSLRAEFINAQQDVNVLAKEAGTIGYEIFTRLGARVKRIYHEL